MADTISNWLAHPFVADLPADLDAQLPGRLGSEQEQGGVNVARAHPGAEKTFVHFAGLGDEGVFDEADELVDLGRERRHAQLGIHGDIAHAVHTRANLLHALLKFGT